MGMTVAEARQAIEKQLARYLKSPEVSVDVRAYNSKVYYVITQGAGLGDSVRRLPITGKETVLDAISQINGLSQVSSKNIWIVRPSDSEKARILPVDWDGISARGATATNYQIFPGDRVYIGEDPVITRTNLLGKKTAPIERTMGIIGLTTSTLDGLKGPPADSGVLKELVRKGFFTDDEELKQLMLDAIRLREQETKKAGAKPAAEEKTGEAQPAAEGEGPASMEVDLKEYSVTVYQPASNSTMRIDFHLHGIVASSDKQEFDRLFELNQSRFREQVMVVIRSAEMADLTDPSLRSIKRTMLEKVRNILGKPLLQELVISDYSSLEN
jgi:hypothetical protein